MRTSPQLVVFDFDGTLAHRPGMWTQCLLDVLDAVVPCHRVTFEDLRPHLRAGFPWHRPEVAHPELNDPDDWWRALGSLLDQIYTAVGVDPARLGALRVAVRDHYSDASRFSLYPDTIAALDLTRGAGAQTVILSNHIPELGHIVAKLGIGHLVDDVFTSALLGVEKPHPEAFRHALGRIQPGAAWMIGDNPIADKQGAMAVGMNALLVRHPEGDFPDSLSAVRHACDSPTSPDPRPNARSISR